MSYNGWTNKQTWLINLWDNSEAWQERATMIASDVEEGYCDPVNDGIWEADRAVVYILEDEIKDYYEEQAQEMTGESSVWTDLTNSALGLVNWRELAEHYAEDAS